MITPRRSTHGACLPLLAALDPRARLLLVFAVVLAAFFVSSLGGAILAGMGLVLLMPALSVPGRWKTTLLPAVGLFAVGFGLNLLLIRDGDAIWRVPLFGITVTDQGLERGLRLGLRVLNLTLYAALLALSTPAAALGRAAASLLAPAAAVFGSRVHAVLFQMQLAIRFVPILTREARRIMLSQRLRGHRFEGSLPRRARALGPVFIPVFATSLLKAHRLALALAARGYRPGMPQPAPLRQRWQLRDSVALAGTIALLVGLWRGVG